MAGAAVILSLFGQVTVTDAGGVARTPALYEPVHTGATVCTDEASYVTLRLAVAQGSHDHDDINLFPGTCLTVKQATADDAGRSSVVAVSSGGVSVRQSETPGTVTVQTDSGETKGDGGGYRVTVEQEAMRTEALYAKVDVVGMGKTVALEAGQGSRVKTGEVPSDPVDLLLPGTPTFPEPRAPLRRTDFRWTTVDGAFGYRFEMGTSPDFADVVFAEDVAETTLRPTMLFLPFRVPGLWWRVSSFDRLGFLGVPSDAREVGVPAGLGP